MAGEIVKAGQLEGSALALPGAVVEAARGFAQASRAKRTLEAYRADWAAFTGWCEAHGLASLPAAPQTVALYLSARASEGRKVATLARALAAISQAHKTAGLASPRSSAPVQEVWKGIRRTLGTAQRQAAPMLPAHLRAVSASLPERLIGVRDRALLLLGYAGAFRRSELAGLEVADLVFAAGGLEVTLRRSKTDQEGRGARKVLRPGANPDTCPVRAVHAWLEAAGLERGPVFREVTKHGRIGTSPLTGRSVARIVKRSAQAAGLEPAQFSGHSLRAGLVTAAALADVPENEIREVTGHSSSAMVQRYIRAARLYKNRAAGVGL